MATRGLKRLCASCGTKFYDLGKTPIICPSCGAEFTGEVIVKSRRAKSSIVADTVKREAIEEKNREAMTEDDADTVSLDELDERNDNLDIDDMEGDVENDDDLSDLESDVDINIDEEINH